MFGINTEFQYKPVYKVQAIAALIKRWFYYTGEVSSQLKLCLLYTSEL